MQQSIHVKSRVWERRHRVIQSSHAQGGRSVSVAFPVQRPGPHEGATTWKCIARAALHRSRFDFGAWAAWVMPCRDGDRVAAGDLGAMHVWPHPLPSPPHPLPAWFWSSPPVSRMLGRANHARASKSGTRPGRRFMSPTLSPRRSQRPELRLAGAGKEAHASPARTQSRRLELELPNASSPLLLRSSMAAFSSHFPAASLVRGGLDTSTVEGHRWSGVPYSVQDDRMRVRAASFRPGCLPTGREHVSNPDGRHDHAIGR